MDHEDSNLLLAQIIDLLRDVIMYPSEMISILNQISYKPSSPSEENHPSKYSYFMDIYNQEGVLGFTRGLLSFIFIHYLYAYIWASTTESSDQMLSSMFGQQILLPDYPGQLSLEYRLSRMLMREGAAVICSHPVHVLQTRQVAQFVGKESKYSSVVFGLVQTYLKNGVCGFFYGLLPRLSAILILNAIIETFDWAFETYLHNLETDPPRSESVFNHFILNHKEESKNLNRRFARILGILLCGNFDKVTTNMEVDDSCLEADNIEGRPKYQPWFRAGVNVVCRVPPKRKPPANTNT